MPMRSMLSFTFSSIRISVSGFMLRSLFHLDLSFVQDDKYGSIIIPGLVKHQLLKMVSFSLYVFGFFVTDQISIGVSVYLWVLILFHRSTFVSLF